MSFYICYKMVQIFNSNILLYFHMFLLIFIWIQENQIVAC